MPNNQTGGPSPADAGGGGGIPGIGIATQVGQSALGQVMGMIFGNAQDKRQYRQAEKLQNLQIVGQKHMVDYNYAKQLQMWHDTGYGAQVKQMKEAGINPGLLYGMSGGGGQTTGQATGNVTGHQAAGASGEGVMMARTIMELGLQRAQRENIEASTEKIKAETEKTAGVDTELARTQTASLTQGITNQKVTAELQKVETELKRTDLAYNKETFEARINQLNIITDTALEQYQIVRNEKILNTAQLQDRIDLLKEQVAGQIVQNALSYQKIEESQAQINKWAAEIAQGWTKIAQEGERIEQEDVSLAIRGFEADIKAKYPGVWNVIGGAVNDATRRLGNLFGDKNPSPSAPKGRK